MPPAPRSPRVRCARLREPGSAAVLVKAVPEVCPGVPRSPPALDPLHRGLRVERRKGVPRVPHRAIGQDPLGVQALVGINRLAVVDRPGQRLEPIHVIGHRQDVARRRQFAWSTFHEARAARCRGSSRASVCMTTRFVVYSNASSAWCSRPSASRSIRRASSAWVARTAASNRSLVLCAVRTRIPVAPRSTSTTGSPSRARRDRSDSGSLDVDHRAACDRPPLERPADPDESVVVEEAQEVVQRVVQDVG